MDEMFDNLVQEYLAWLVERHPVTGTSLGLHEYDHLLPDGSRRAVLDEAKKVKEFQDRFLALDEKELSPEKKIEREAMIHLLRMSLFYLEEYRQWQSNPTGVDLIGASIFRLYARDFAPLKQRLISITRRLEKAPEYLSEYRSRISQPVKLWVEVQLESCKRFFFFLDDILKTAENVLESTELEDMRKAVTETREAVRDYENWLREDLLPQSEDDYCMGEDLFKRIIELKKLGLTLEEIRELGRYYLEENKKRLHQIAETISPGAGVEKVREMIKSKHPRSFDDVIKEYRDWVKRSRRFLEEHGLLNIPEGERLEVVETPSYLRHTTPFAAYLMPGKFDERQEGLYLVTPVEDKTEMLKEHSYASIANTSVHEGYPGHHLQLVYSNMLPSLVPTLVHASETVEGWAHYCEDWMMELGFNDSPETRFIQTTDLIWRAARIIVDVEMHTKRMTLEESVNFLMEHVGMERAGALAEVRRYSMNPAYQLCYLIGKHLILQLKEEVRRRMGDAYTDQFFHNTFLEAGGLPMYLVRKIFDVRLKEMGLSE